MSNQRTRVVSFTPEQEAEPTTLKRARSGEVGTTSLPYDIFLHVIEALIEDVLAGEEPVDWDLKYQYDMSPTIFVQENDQRCQWYPSNSQMIRWSRSRLASQINYQTRQMVNRVLPRTAMLNEDGTVSSVAAWLRPDIDAFIPLYKTSPGLDFNQMCFNAALLYPSSCNAFIQHIEHVRLLDFDWITDVNDDDLAALGTLPNLQLIQMEIGIIHDLKIQHPIHFGFHQINQEVFPTLNRLARAWDSEFMKKFSPMQDKNVRLYGAVEDSPEVEIRGTKEGIRARMVEANCTCCKPDDGMRRAACGTAQKWRWDPRRFSKRRQR